LPESNYNILVNKLDEFIRKYYKNQLIRGSIYFFSTAILFLIIIATVEYFGHFGATIRTIIFYTYIILNAVIITKLAVIPLLNLNKIGKFISHNQAAAIIGSHFAEVHDKLLNILQLHEISKISQKQKELIEASIRQKIKEIKPIPFTLAIDLKQNIKYLKYALIPVLVIFFTLFSSTKVIQKGTTRIISHNKYFEEEAPFRFQVLNNKLETVQQKDFELDVKLTGNEIPENIFIETGKTQFKLEKENTVLFHFTFKSPLKNIKFRFTADGYESREYELKVLPNPIVLNFQIFLDYPKYLNKKSETLNNTGDLLIPEGTKVTWKFLTKDTKILRIGYKDSVISIKPSDENHFDYTRQIRENLNYKISTTNDFVNNSDSITYLINVISDAYPVIKVDEFKDTLSLKRLYYKGNLKDDYGFSKLTFNYRYLKREDSLSTDVSKKIISKNIIISNSITQQDFYYYWDLNTVDISPGDEVEYYFEVWDNDGVNGSKSARSEKLIYKVPSLKELNESASKNNDKLKQDLENNIAQTKKLQKDIENLRLDLLQKKNLDWNDKNKLKDIISRQNELQKSIDNAEKENKENNIRQSESGKTDERILEKQKQLEELFKNVMTDEMKKLMEEIQKLLDKVDKNEIQQMLEKMQLSTKDLEKEIDRNLEIFKQLEFEQKLQQNIDNLKDMAKKEENLSKETDKKNPDNKQLEEKQKDINKDFEDFKKDMKELEKKNQQLEKPNNLKNTDAKQNEIQQEIKNSTEQLENKKNSKASQSQKNASNKMNELSEQLEQMQKEMEEQNDAEDAEALREILENLLRVSFSQEALMNKLNKTSINDPQYPKIMQEQKKLKDYSQMIEDSMYALSKRQVQLQSVVNREISSININIGKAIGFLEARNSSMASSRQQYVMTSLNNLALILDESLKQAQMKASSKKCKGNCKKSGMCSKPGSQKSSISSVRQMQQELNKQIQKLKEELEKQGNLKSPKQNNQKSGMSEKISKLAAEQEALRNELQKLSQELKDNPKGNSGEIEKIAKQMDETETDLVNKILSNETLKRQQEILTRLLDAEKAERERGEEEKRESREAKDENYSNFFKKFKYNYIKINETELLKTVPPTFNIFYKNKVNEYFNNFGLK
jgi:hypothetical protein